MTSDNLSARTEYLADLSSGTDRTLPLDATVTRRADADSTEQPIRYYQVAVRNQGRSVKQHIVAARDALSAINLVELEYGDPVQAEIIKVKNEDGRQRQILIPLNWHGYTFFARLIEG